MGWLGWSYDQTMNAPIPIIELALGGLIEKLIATNPFGGGKPAAPSEPMKPPTAAEVRAAMRAAVK